MPPKQGQSDVMMKACFVCVTLLVAFITIPPSLGISDEYDGYIHLHERDVTKDEILLDASDIKLSADVWSAVCEQIEECRAFNDRGFLKSFPHNSSVDAYISHRTCGEHGKAKVVNGSCLSPQASYIACHDERGNLDTFYNVKASYRLPPNLVAQACDIDDRCVGFMVTQNRQEGWLLEHFKSPTVHGVYTLRNYTQPGISSSSSVKVIHAKERLRSISHHMTTGRRWD